MSETNQEFTFKQYLQDTGANIISPPQSEPEKEEPEEYSFSTYLKNNNINLSDLSTQVEAPEISFAREFAFGAAQEPTVVGSLFRLGKAAFQSFFDPYENYEQARKRIEDARQERIFENFKEFRGRPESLNVLAGRGAVAMGDPVTFLIPWAKVAKAGKIASLAAGGTFAASDMAIREEALYGKIDPMVVGLGFGLGVAGAQIGDMAIAGYSRYLNKPVNETVEVTTKSGQKLNKKVAIDGSKESPVPTKEDLPTLEKLAQQTAIDAEESLNNLGKLYADIAKINERRKQITSELRKEHTRRKKLLTKEELEDDYVFELVIKAGADKERKKLSAELKTLNQQVKTILEEEIPNNLLDVFEKSLVNGQKAGVLTEGITRALVQEITRPLVGGIIGGAIGGTFTGEDEGNEKMMYFASLGAMALFFQRRIQKAPFKLIPKKIKNAAGEEFVSSFRRGYYNVLKSITAASHVQDLMSMSEPVVNYAAKMFKMQGGGVKLGQTGKILPVEEAAILQLGLWRNRLGELVAPYDDEVLVLAGKISNQKGLVSKEHSFLTAEDLANPNFKLAEKISEKIDKYTEDFRNYAEQAGLRFTDEDRYGLTQIINIRDITPESQPEIVERLAKAFQLQRKNNPQDGKPLSDADAAKIAGNYFRTSTNYRKNSIWAEDARAAKFIDADGNVVSKQNNRDLVLTSARHFTKARTLYDQEARALVSDLFEQNPIDTLTALTNNTIKIAEFSRRFGSNAQGINKLFNDIDAYFKKIADPNNVYKTSQDLYNNVRGVEVAANYQKKKIKDSLEAYFGVYGADNLPKGDFMQGFVTFLQSGLLMTRLAKVAIPSIGDWLQTISNSGYYPAFKAAISDIKLSKQGLGLDATRKQVKGKDATFVDKFLGNNRIDSVIERELSDVLLQGGGNLKRYQLKASDVTRQFFEIVQLGRVTRLARRWSFDTGVHRAMDIAKIIGKGKRPGILKTKQSIQKEIDGFNLNVDNMKYLAQFETIQAAINDPIAKKYLLKAGLSTANRDALIPFVGNRRLFSQSKNPTVKFLGSFLSWAQAKSSQTNALLTRIEEGDIALFLRIAAVIPLYMAVREAQLLLARPGKYKEDAAEETFAQKVFEGLLLTGMPTVWVDKIRGMFKFASPSGGFELEQLAPVIGFGEDLADVFYKPLLEALDEKEAGEELESLKVFVDEAEDVIPILRDIQPSRFFEEEPKKKFTTGGLVIGEDKVPFTKENPADRVDPFTGEPYSDRIGLENGGLPTNNEKERYKKIFNELPESLKQDKHIINVDGSDYVVDKRVNAEDFEKKLSDFSSPEAYIGSLEAKMKRLLEKEESPLGKVGREVTNFLAFLTNSLNPKTTINDIRYINAPYFSEREKEMLKDYK